MKNVLLLASVLVSFVLAGAFFCTPTVQAGETATTYSIGVTCTTTGQLCEPRFEVRPESGETLKARYRVPESIGCSSVRVHFFVNGTLRHTSDFLGWHTNPGAGPLDTGMVELGPVSPGIHILEVQAEGTVGGCNSGNLHRWEGTLEVVTSTAPLEPAEVHVLNFPDTQQVQGVVSISNLPAVQPVTGAVSVSNLPTNDEGDLTVARPAVQNVILDLLDGEVLLAPDGMPSWESEVFETAEVTRIGLRVRSEAAGGPSPLPTEGGTVGIPCSVLWQWTDEDEFDGPPILVRGTDTQWGLVYGLRAKVVCQVSSPVSGTLTDVQVFLRTE